ncbi:MAG: hypothetical protein KJ607_12505 [Bacteroidetes bacterium]|nr:hypothetical protein [Bacteroidota bacterium]
MKSVIVIIVLLLQVFSFSQTPVNNIERYWHYRERLKYFVKVGTGEGESCVTSYRNKNNNAQLHFGDQTIFLAWYIGVLATE